MQAKAIVNFNSKPMLVLGGYGVTVIQWKVYEWTFPFHEFYSDWFIKKNHIWRRQSGILLQVNRTEQQRSISLWLFLSVAVRKELMWKGHMGEIDCAAAKNKNCLSIEALWTQSICNTLPGIDRTFGAGALTKILVKNHLHRWLVLNVSLIFIVNRLVTPARE